MSAHSGCLCPSQSGRWRAHENVAPNAHRAVSSTAALASRVLKGRPSWTFSCSGDHLCRSTPLISSLRTLLWGVYDKPRGPRLSQQSNGKFSLSFPTRPRVDFPLYFVQSRFRTERSSCNGHMGRPLREKGAEEKLCARAYLLAHERDPRCSGYLTPSCSNRSSLSSDSCTPPTRATRCVSPRRASTPHARTRASR